MPPSTRRVALYARLSVSTEESVSIERQFEAGRKLAEARGRKVVLEEKDNGVSATQRKPEDRVSWRTILESESAIRTLVALLGNAALRPTRGAVAASAVRHGR